MVVSPLFTHYQGIQANLVFFMTEYLFIALPPDLFHVYSNKNFLFQIVAEEVGLSGLSASADVTVNLLDENDNVPKFEEDYYDVTIPENVQPGTVILQVKEKLYESYNYDKYTVKKLFLSIVGFGLTGCQQPGWQCQEVLLVDLVVDQIVNWWLIWRLIDSLWPNK